MFSCQAKVDLTLLLVTQGSGFCKRGRWQEKGPAESFTPKKMLRDKWELRSEIFESARPRLVGGRVMLFTFSFFAGVLEQGVQSHRALGQLWAARSELQWRLNSSARLQRKDKRQRRGGADSWETVPLSPSYIIVHASSLVQSDFNVLYGPTVRIHCEAFYFLFQHRQSGLVRYAAYSCTSPLMRGSHSRFNWKAGVTPRWMAALWIRLHDNYSANDPGRC